MSIAILNEDQKIERIVSAISSVVGQIKSGAAESIAVFKANAVLDDGLLSTINVRQFQILSDEPPSLGGEDRGPNPVELILGAFAACQEIVIKAYAAILGIKVDAVHVETKGNLDLRGFFNVADVRAGFNSVEFVTTISTGEQDEEKLSKLLYFAENRCPVFDILQNPVPVSGTFKFTKENKYVKAS